MDKFNKIKNKLLEKSNEALDAIKNSAESLAEAKAAGVEKLDALKDKLVEKSNEAVDSIKSAAKSAADSATHVKDEAIEKFDELKDKAVEKSNNTLALIKTNAETVALEQVSSLDFTEVKHWLEGKTKDYPEIKNLTNTICVVEEGIKIYKISESEDKDKELINHVVAKIDLKNSIAILENVVDFIPYGNILMILLKFILRRKLTSAEKSNKTQELPEK